MIRHVLQNVVHIVAVLVRDKHAARTAVDLRKTLTGCANGRGVNNGHHLIKMIVYQSVEEGFVSILDVTQVDVLVDFGFESLILDPCSFRLFFDGFDHFRQ